MSSYTTFKVIKIIDDYSLVINGGLTDDVSLGDEIEIFLEGDEVVDPFNNEKPLGTLDFIKENLEVTEIYPHFAVCKKITKKEIHQPSAMQRAFQAAAYMGGAGGVTETEVVEEKINIREEDKTGRRTGDKVIKIGDIARIAISGE